MESRLNIKSVLINIVVVLLLAVFTGCGKPEVTELSSQTLEQDTSWSGVIVINGDIYVPPGVTLTVEPGTIVRFKKIDEKSDQNLFHPDSPYYPEAELIIRGRLIARGTPDRQIVFTSAEMRPNPADWGALNFLGSDGNVIEHVKIYCAYNGIHAHGSSVHIANSEFARNGVAISFKKEEEEPGAPWFGKPSDMRIVNSIFANNKGGIGCRNSTAEILHNEIRENKFFGIWPKEACEALISYNEIKDNDRGVYLYQVQGMQLEHNNIYNNRSYDIAVAEAQDFPVNAPNNWFGTTDPVRIADRLFDRDDDADVAEIVIQPVLAGPVEWKAKS
ncbi:MAG: right-handed parallel beta-helix repeat-containing protein [Desulfobulbaceae bacterium]|jgi:parallel beta-helix repeat protein|nr:right-handed parallel beta-helix repeat-containing protein [Desulfobulbaceae bacterium]